MSERREGAEVREAASAVFQTPEAGPLEATGAASPNVPPSAPVMRWWWVELWCENREIFKELVKHILFFGMLFGGLVLFHYINEHSDLPPHRKEALDTVHFWGTVIALVIFTASFIIKLTINEFRGKKHE